MACGVLHPLQTIASPETGVADPSRLRFRDLGRRAGLAWAERISTLLGGVPLRIAPDRMPLYHAAAVMASNCVTGLIDAAVILMNAAGIEEKTALGRARPSRSAPVWKTRWSWVLEKALTGPIRRGDVETVLRHLTALSEAPASVGGLYRSAGLHALEVARRSGLAEPKAREIEAMLGQGR